MIPSQPLHSYFFSSSFFSKEMLRCPALSEVSPLIINRQWNAQFYWQLRGENCAIKITVWFNHGPKPGKVPFRNSDSCIQTHLPHFFSAWWSYSYIISTRHILIRGALNPDGVLTLYRHFYLFRVAKNETAFIAPWSGFRLDTTFPSLMPMNHPA